MSIKTSQAILKCFIDLKSSVWFMLGSEVVTLRTFVSSTAGQGFQNTKWPAVPYSQLSKFHKSKKFSHSELS